MKNINSLGLFDDYFLMEKLTKFGRLLERLKNSLIGSLIGILLKPINEVPTNESRTFPKEVGLHLTSFPFQDFINSKPWKSQRLSVGIPNY